MKKAIIIALLLLVVVGCNPKRQGSSTLTSDTKQNVCTILKERITILDCKDVNGDYICDDIYPRVVVREFENGYLVKETEYLNEEIVGVLRYRVDENNNLYMTNTFKGRLIKKIYKDENGKWITLLNGEISENPTDFELLKPKYCGWIEYMEKDIIAIGGKDIRVSEIQSGDMGHKLDCQCYITYTLPDDTEEIILVKKEIL